MAAIAALAACSRRDPPPREQPQVQSAPEPAAAAPAPAQPVAQEAPASIVADDRPEPGEWQKAAERITLLDPDQFPEAPPELRQALKSVGCLIPQTFATYTGYFEPPWPKQDNLVPGHFKSTAELHWAVLCTRGGKTSLLLFDSLGQNMETLAGPRDNAHLLIGTRGNDDPDFSWSIAADDLKVTMDAYRRYGGDGPVPPPILHEALSSTSDESSSTTYFWHQCKWIEVTTGC